MIGRLESVFAVPQGHRRLRECGECGVETGNGRGKSAGEDEATQARRNHRGDPNGKNRIGVLGEERSFRRRRGMLLVVNEERGSDREHEHGDKQRNAAGDDGLRGILRVAAAEHALRVELVRAERGDILERHGQQADPQGELDIRIGRQIEQTQLAGLAGLRDEGGEASVDPGHEKNERQQPAADEDEELDDIGPNDRGHAAHQSPPDGEHADDDDAPLEGEAGDRPQNQRGDEQAHALSEDRTDEEQRRGEGARAGSESRLHVVVGTEDPAFVENFDEPDPDDEARHERTDAPLQVSEVTARSEDHAGHTDEGDRADFRGNDRTGDRRPRQRAAREEEVLHGRLLAAQRVTDPCGEQQIGGENHPVDPQEMGMDAFHAKQLRRCPS